jgi:hypothetical protein
MRFPGYWVSENEGKIEVSAAEFDDTDLSDHSDWKEAWQNGDPEYPHGFIDPLTMLHAISKRIVGEIDAAQLDEIAANFREGSPYLVNDLQDLARLIQLLIPKTLPKSANSNHPLVPTDDAGEEIPF